MRHPAHLSHLFGLLLGAVLGMARGTAAAMVTASGSALVRTVENSTAHQWDGGTRKAGTAAGDSPIRTGAYSAGLAADLPASAADRLRARSVQARQHTPHHGSGRLHRSGGSPRPRRHTARTRSTRLA